MINTNTPKIGLVSLGCPKNQCDAELMLAAIAKAGYKLVAEPGLADVVIINTCGFIQSAKEEAIEEIFEAISRKNDGINKKIIVTGCLSERYKQQLADEFPEVDGVLGIGKNADIVKVIESVLLKGHQVCEFGDVSGHSMEGERLLTTLPHYAYLRIADGCDNRCTYCAIPLFRGGFRSRTIENIAEEAENLARDGVRELILVAQDVTNYGSDLYGKIELAKLLKRLTEIDKIKWIRLLYCYPHRIASLPELVEVIRDEEKIVKYLDLPIQHCNSEILKNMNRVGSGSELAELMDKLRREIPGIVLRTTLLTGFPGETEEQFTELAEFAHKIRFEHLGCFAYSPEEGTAAAEMPDQVDDDVKARRKEVIEEQQAIRVGEWLDSLIDGEFEVVVEGFDRYLGFDEEVPDESQTQKGKSGVYFGRTYMQAPEIDGMVYFTVETDKKPVIGEFVRVKITDVLDNNLIGVML
ncbi:MAG: 30S ribosomal protein S12 methylthiotransferase RimO [Oscillospiraceae bacterium]|nr:30S ribosomal protein S12 methylthiotransferase RimO [Oscillospiraceae bacterium]